MAVVDISAPICTYISGFCTYPDVHVSSRHSFSILLLHPVSLIHNTTVNECYDHEKHENKEEAVCDNDLYTTWWITFRLWIWFWRCRRRWCRSGRWLRRLRLRTFVRTKANHFRAVESSRTSSKAKSIICNIKNAHECCEEYIAQYYFSGRIWYQRYLQLAGFLVIFKDICQ